MSYQLAPRHEALIERLITTGTYPNVDQVIDDALSLLDQEARLTDLRAKLQRGLEALDHGESTVFSADWSAGRVQIARERVAAGDQPSPDVCP